MATNPSACASGRVQLLHSSTSTRSDEKPVTAACPVSCSDVDVLAARAKEQALGRAKTAFTARAAEAKRLERAFQGVFGNVGDLVRAFSCKFQHQGDPVFSIPGMDPCIRVA